MMVDKVEGGLAKVVMSQVEAQVLANALTAAKIAIGDDFVLGEEGRQYGINIEHLCGVLTGIAERK